MADVVDSVCYSVKAALFEVPEDIKDRNQYTLVKPLELIVDLLNRWESDGLARGKVR